MTIAIRKYDGTINTLKSVLDLCEGLENIKPNDNILIKPNLVISGGIAKRMPKYGAVTTTRLVQDLIIILKEKGYNNITIGEGSAENRDLKMNTMAGYKWVALINLPKSTI